MDCISKIARNIGLDCVAPLVGGNRGDGLIISADDIKSISQDAQNPRKVLNIVLNEGAKVCYLDNASLTTPLEGSNTTGNSDAGFAQFVKVLSARVLSRGADNSLELVEPLVKSRSGFVAIVAKNDRVGDGSFEVVGLMQPLKCVDPASVVRNENENGGAITFSLQATEPWFELTLCPTPEDGETQYSASKRLFDKLAESKF